MQENNDPSQFLLIRLTRDKTIQGNYFYAVFDDTGDFVNVKIQDHGNEKILSSEQSFNEKELTKMGFTKIWNIKDTHEKGYLEGKGLKIYDECHCLIQNTVIKQKQCKKECIKPKTVRTVQFN